MALGGCPAGGEDVYHFGLSADKIGEVAAEAGMAGLSGATDLSNVALGAGMAAGREEEHGDDDISAVVAGLIEEVLEERIIEGVKIAFATLHGGSGDPLHGASEEEAELTGDEITHIRH